MRGRRDGPGPAGRGLSRNLGAYFPRRRWAARRSPWPRPSVRVVLPALDEAQRAQVEALVRGHVAARRAPKPPVAAGGVVVRFHSTVRGLSPRHGPAVVDGRRDHRHPHRTASARSPAAPGLLDRTLRHELAHALTGPALAMRRGGCGKGVADYVSGDQAAATAATGRPTRCPEPTRRSAGGDLRARRSRLLYDRALALRGGARSEPRGRRLARSRWRGPDAVSPPGRWC